MRLFRMGQALWLVASASIVGAAPPEAGAKATPPDVPRSAPAGLPREAAAATPQLTLVVYDVHEVLDADFPRFIKETSAIFKEMGADVAWRRGGLGTVHGSGPVREIPVILLKEPPGKLQAKRDVLGLIPKDQPPAIWVFVENVKRSIGVDASERTGGLAVALGRVVAHEIVHSVAPGLGHTKAGLMRHALDRAALVGAQRPSHAECAGAVRAALGIGPPPQPFAGVTALLSPPRY